MNERTPNENDESACSWNIPNKKVPILKLLIGRENIIETSFTATALPTPFFNCLLQHCRRKDKDMTAVQFQHLDAIADCSLQPAARRKGAAPKLLLIPPVVTTMSHKCSKKLRTTTPLLFAYANIQSIDINWK